MFLSSLALMMLSASVYSEPAARQYLDSMRPNQRRAMSVDEVDGQYFYKVTTDLKAKRVLEIGTSTGYSGGWFAMALKQTGGRLTTLEVDNGRWSEAQKTFAAMGVADIIDSRLCDALEELKKLEGPFDVVFIDAWKPDYLKYYELVIGKVRPGGVILAHNVKNQRSQMSPFLDRILSDAAVRTEFVTESVQGLSASWKK